MGPLDDRGLQACIEELVDCALEEHFAGFCTRIDVVLLADHSCSVANNGRGISVEIDPRFDLPAVEALLTQFSFGRCGHALPGERFIRAGTETRE